MLQKEFRHFFLENILSFLWRQWSFLGIAGGARSEDEWVIDPEALLLFSIEICRYEPRLFDEVLDWLAVNGKWMDIQRLRGIVKSKDEKTQLLMSAVANFLSQEARSFRRKWQALAKSKAADLRSKEEMLFNTREGEPFPKPREISKPFYEYGFLRENFSLRKMSRPVSVAVRNNIRFLLRSLFGIGSRSECILYLLTHEAGHPAEVADAIGISVRAIQDTLIELSDSGLVLTRIKGKRKIEYWLSQRRWGEFLLGASLDEEKLPVWLDWISLFSALNNVLDVLNEVEQVISDYLRSSKLREAMETISLEFSKSGLDLPPVPGEEISPDMYEEEFQNFITKVLRTGGEG
ncbi:MAG: hypothetical protein KAU46_10405 [Candidatus Aminicenantes bacterium]|nr:hypothetical protein [Candidatus Aminicenantes bacterium]